MSYRTEDDKYRKPREIFPPPVNELFANPKFWNKRTITYIGEKKYFDQEVRTGICYFCKREGRAQKSRTTYLHHVKYDHQDYLAWTVEVCSSCHWHIDENNRRQIDKHYGNTIPRKFGKYDSPYYETKKVKAWKEKDNWKKFVLNTSWGYLDPVTHEKIPESIIRKLKKMDSEKETMSSVSRRYFSPETEE